MPGCPEDPQQRYYLNWEDPLAQKMPSEPPPCWSREYDPNVRHDGQPQVRISDWGREPQRCGNHSVRFQLYKSDPIINGGTRAEITAGFEPVGAERWYGFSIYLPSSWVPDRSAEILTQWHQHWDIGTSPPLAIQTRNGKWEIGQNWEGPYYFNTQIGDYETDRWTDWVIHVKWSADTDGVLDIWRDGSPVPGFFQKPGKNTYYDPLHGNYLKIGIYKWDWSQNKPSDTTCRVMFHDELQIADERGSYESVHPGFTLVPPVVGLTQAQAASRVKAAALLSKFSAYGRGLRYVRSQVPAAGTRQRCGTTVTMQVSPDSGEDHESRRTE